MTIAPPISPAQLQRDREDRALFALLLWSDKDRIGPTWNRLAPRSYRGLATALISSPMLAPAGCFWFNPDTAQFAHGTRGYVPNTAIRHALDVFNANHAAELANLTLALGEGKMPLPYWQQAMTTAIKDAQAVNAAIGKGGLHSLEDGDIAFLTPTISYQLSRLDRFADQIAEGEVEAERAANRAGTYAKSAISSYSGMRRRAADVAGFTLEKNILGSAEHCAPDPLRPGIADCPSLTAAGWVSLGALPPIGERLCLWNCHCRISYSRG